MAADLHREWLSATEIAALGLPGLPATRQGSLKYIQREGWDRTDKTRRRSGRGGGVEYHVSLLPDAAQAALLAMRQARAEEVVPSAAAADPQPKTKRLDDDGRAALWVAAVNGMQTTDATGNGLGSVFVRRVANAHGENFDENQAIAVLDCEVVTTIQASDVMGDPADLGLFERVAVDWNFAGASSATDQNDVAGIPVTMESS